jgi:hypothetical protein
MYAKTELTSTICPRLSITDSRVEATVLTTPVTLAVTSLGHVVICRKVRHQTRSGFNAPAQPFELAEQRGGTGRCAATPG